MSLSLFLWIGQFFAPLNVVYFYVPTPLSTIEYLQESPGDFSHCAPLAITGGAWCE